MILAITYHAETCAHANVLVLNPRTIRKAKLRVIPSEIDSIVKFIISFFLGRGSFFSPT